MYPPPFSSYCYFAHVASELLRKRPHLGYANMVVIERLGVDKYG